MERPALKLVVPPRLEEAGAPSPRPVVLGLGVLVLAAAAIASLLGADRAREETDPIREARDALPGLLENGPDDPRVRKTLSSLRKRLASRPLDAKARVVYAGLLLELSGNAGDASAAVFHASKAAELAPVTVPVVRAAATVLARAGERERALDLTREMFLYDPTRAAELLASLEFFVWPDGAARGVPDDPEAWLAWARQLRASGRQDEARKWAEEAHDRWPEYLPALEWLARKAARERDWRALRLVLPNDLALPDRPDAAALFALRARARAEAGDLPGARTDAQTAVRLAEGRASVLVPAGDALLVAGRPVDARRSWKLALYHLTGGKSLEPTRVGLLVRLARLEDENGRPAEALRAWRAVLEESPDHREARQRVDDLTGFRRSTGRP